MGWYRSPPFFCASSETEIYVIDTLLHQVNPPEHPFEEQIIADQTENPRHRLTTSVTYKNPLELFVYDFIAETNNPYLSYLTHFLSAMLHGVHYIFPPPKVTIHQGQDPISQKTSTGIGNMGHNEGNIGADY